MGVIKECARFGGCQRFSGECLYCILRTEGVACPRHVNMLCRHALHGNKFELFLSLGALNGNYLCTSVHLVNMPHAIVDSWCVIIVTNIEICRMLREIIHSHITTIPSV